MSKEIPDPYCCIFHARSKALSVYKVVDTKSQNMYQYGLCPICDHRLAKQESFKQDISDRLEEILRQIQKKREEQQNANPANRR